MDKYMSLVGSSQKASQSRMKKFIQETETNQLCKMVLDILNKTDAYKVLDNLLLGFTDLKDPRNQEKRYKLVKSVFERLCNVDATSKDVSDIVKRIVIEFPYFNRSHLVKLVDFFVERIKKNDDVFMSWKDVLPLLLERVEEEKFFNYNNREVTGHEYKMDIIDQICHIDWDIKILAPLALMFTEIPIENKDKNHLIMRSVTSKMRNMELVDLPPLIHPLLKLGLENSSTLLFANLTKFFNNCHANASDDNYNQETFESIESGKVNMVELLETESTVFYHIYNSALDNTKGTDEYMRCLKTVVNTPEYILNPFVMSTLLLFSNMEGEQALQILKLALLRQIQEQEYKSQSGWLRKVSENDLDVIETIDRVINNSNKDRQLVLNGMVNFGFLLLSTERKVGVDSHPPWDYGCQLLQMLAKRRDDIGGHILEIVVNKIVGAGATVTQYTDCLSYMCRKQRTVVMNHQNSLTNLMDNLLVIPGTAAAQVLRAILPLIRMSGVLRDSLIMVLRKALYRKGTETRRMAVLGFLQLLKNLKLQTLNSLSQSVESISSTSTNASMFTSSQVHMEPRPSQNRQNRVWFNTTLCREILSILSKCFTHEPEVRTHLYQEIYHCVVKNHELTEYVIEMLLDHFNKFYEKDKDVLPPINFDKCCGCQGIEPVIEEPIAELIFALHRIYCQVATDDSILINKLAVILESLCSRMAQTDLEQLGLTDDLDLLDGTPKNQQKLLSLKLAITVYEALIAYRICSWSTESSSEIGLNVLSLFKGYQRCVEYLKKLGKGKKGGKGKKDKDKDETVAGGAAGKKGSRQAAVKMPNTVMDLDTIAKCIVLLFNKNNSHTTEAQTDAIRKRDEFYLYILLCCIQLLQNVKNLKNDELTSYLELNKQNLITIGETLYNSVVSQFEKAVKSNRFVAEMSLECFKECCEVMCTLYANELPTFLEKISKVEQSKGLLPQLQGLISSLKDTFETSLNIEEIEEETKTNKNPFVLIETISKFIQKVPFNELEDDSMFDWLIEFAKNKDDIDCHSASLIFQLILLIDERIWDYSKVLQDLAAEFIIIFGKTNKDEVTGTRVYLMVNNENADSIYVSTNKILMTKLQNVNWQLGRLNAEYTAMISLEMNSESDKKKLIERETKLCRQLTFLIGVFETLTSVKIKIGQASDILFKNLLKVYNLACALARYFRKKSTKNNPAFQSVKFISVIQGAGNTLKQAVQEMILHIEATQTAGGKNKDGNVQRNKILKEVKVIPSVSQAIDIFDKEIVMLEKKTDVPLMKFCKCNAVRDFRISDDVLMDNIEKMNVTLGITQTGRNNETNDDSSDEDNEAEVEGEEEEEGDESDSEPSPPKKRRCN